MKKALLVAAVLLLGAGLFAYPYAATYFADKNASEAVQNYAEAVNAADTAALSDELERARAYTRELSGEEIHDPFIPGSGMALGEDYTDILSLTDAMGYVYIPKINVSLAIYHGTSEATLQKGAGHLEGSALPVGGEGTHTVLTGHSGLTNARMFTDLVELKKGDTFYIHVLDETLAYRVDQIKVVEPSYTRDLIPVRDEDHATLITCTPYGVNSHRLLVRGSRIEYVPEAERIAATAETVDGWTAEKWILTMSAAITAAVMALIILIVLLLRRKRAREEYAARPAFASGFIPPRIPQQYEYTPGSRPAKRDAPRARKRSRKRVRWWEHE
jgi:sortase A